MKKNLKSKHIKKNILITGGNGYLGYALQEQISTENYNIFVLNKTKPTKKIHKIKYLQIDISQKKDINQYQTLFKKIDILIHLAAYVPKEQKFDDADKSIKVNITGAINLVNLLNKKTKLIYASTCEIYTVFNDNIINENLDNKQSSFYAISKLFTEKMLEKICQIKDVQFIALRFANIYGQKEKILKATLNFTKSAINNKELVIFGDGQDKRSFIYIEDAVRAIIKAINYRKSNIFNISSGETITILDLAKLIIKIAKSNSKIIFKPRMNEKKDLVFDAKKAKKELKFNSIFNLAEGLKAKIDYLR